MDQTQSSGMPTAPAAKSGSKAGIITAIVIIVLVGGYFLLRPSTPASAPATATTNSITVADQDADSVAVLVSDAQLAVAGFVEIHADLNGAPGDIIGTSALLQPGDHKNVSVIATLKPGATYYAMLHSDDGDGVFKAANDAPIKDVAGNIVMQMFKVKLTSTGGEVKG